MLSTLDPAFKKLKKEKEEEKKEKRKRDEKEGEEEEKLICTFCTRPIYPSSGISYIVFPDEKKYHIGCGAWRSLSDLKCDLRDAGLHNGRGSTRDSEV